MLTQYALSLTCTFLTLEKHSIRTAPTDSFTSHDDSAAHIILLSIALPVMYLWHTTSGVNGAPRGATRAMHGA